MSIRSTTSLMALMALFAALVPALAAPIASEEGNDPVLLRSVDINATIDNAYAVTEIIHTYKNPANESAEAFFSLSIPEKALISNFSLTIGNQTHFADILRTDEAKKKYNQSVTSGKNAGIVEAQDVKRFTFAVNLKGEQEATVALRYEHYLPLYLGDRNYELYLSSMDISPEKFNLHLRIHSTAGLAGLTLENYEDMAEQDWESSHSVSISMEREDFKPEKDLAAVYKENPVPMNGSLLGHYDSITGEYYFFNIFSPEKSDVGTGFSKDIVFVLDKSGSMSGEKITQLKEAFDEIVHQLREDDRFGIIMFDSRISVYKDELIYATDSNKEDALGFLNGINAGGSTNLYDGLERALAMLKYSESRAPIIIMLTDGLANAGSCTSAVPIRENIASRNNIFCPIFTLGFGYDVDFDFLTALSLENYAKAQRIHLNEDASEQIVNFYETISTTLLKNIDIRYPDAAYDHFPESIPAVYEGSESIIVGKIRLYEIDGAFTTRFSAYGPEGKRKFNATYPVGENDTSNGFIKRFWAYAKIYGLMDELTLMSGKEKDMMISEIENLSIEAHFVTPYTSLYLEIDEEDEGEAMGQGQEDDQEHEEDHTYKNTGVTPQSCYDSSSNLNGGAKKGSAPPPGRPLGVPNGACDDDKDESDEDDAGFVPLGFGAIGIGLVFAAAAAGNIIIRKRRR